MRSRPRPNIFAQLVAVLAEAQARRLNPLTVARHAYLNVPPAVLSEALCELPHAAADAWHRETNPNEKAGIWRTTQPTCPTTSRS